MVVSHAFCALCTYSTFGDHPYPVEYFCAKFCFCREPPIAELANGENLHTHYLITHSPSSFVAQGTKILVLVPGT